MHPGASDRLSVTHFRRQPGTVSTYMRISVGFHSSRALKKCACLLIGLRTDRPKIGRLPSQFVQEACHLLPPFDAIHRVPSSESAIIEYG